MLPVHIVDDFEGGALLAVEDANAALEACCQRTAADQAPPADALNSYVHCSLPLDSGHEQEKEELLYKVNLLLLES